MHLKEAIYIKNIGPLAEVSIDEIKPFTAIIGSSASGKSTLMKVLSLMRYIFKMVNIRSYLNHAKITKSPFRLRFNSLLHDGLENMITARSEIIYKVRVDGTEYVLIYKERKLDARRVIDKEHLSFYKEAFIAETRSSIATWASQIARNRGARLGFYFHETFNNFEQATDAIKEQSLDFLNMNLEVRHASNAQKRYFITSSSGVPTVELKHASSGIQSSAPLITIVRYFAKDFSFREAFQRSALNYLYSRDLISKFSPNVELSQMSKIVHLHIEEPELSLDPQAQRKLMNDLVSVAFHERDDDRALNLMFATHSPYIINHLNVLLRASYYDKARNSYPFITPEQMQVYRLVDGRLHSLMSIDNESQQWVVDSYDMAEPIDDIVNEYDNLANI